VPASPRQAKVRAEWGEPQGRVFMRGPHRPLANNTFRSAFTAYKTLILPSGCRKVMLLTLLGCCGSR